MVWFAFRFKFIKIISRQNERKKKFNAPLDGIKLQFSLDFLYQRAVKLMKNSVNKKFNMQRSFTIQISAA